MVGKKKGRKDGRKEKEGGHKDGRNIRKKKCSIYSLYYLWMRSF